MYSIIIADDEQLEREELKKVLTAFFNHDCQIELAQNGREALEAARRIHADIALMDIEMPGMGGIEAARILRAESPDCQIVFLTAYSEFSYARQAVELGAVDYLLKPCSDADLCEVIGRVTAQIESRRDEERRHVLSSRKIENLTQWLEEQLVMTVMGGYLRPERFFSQLEELNIRFRNGVFAILRSPDGISAERIRSIMNGCGWQLGIHLIMYEYDDRLYILAVSSVDADCAQLVHQRLLELSDQMRTLSRKRLYSAVGGRFVRPEDAQNSFYQALTAFGHCNSAQCVCAACCEEPQTIHDPDDGSLEKEISRSVLEGDIENAMRMVAVMLDGLCAREESLTAVAGELEQRLKTVLRRMQEETGVDYLRKYRLHERFFAVEDVSELHAAAKQLMGDLSGEMSGSRGGRVSQAMQEIADYIGKNYNRDIFLQQVAREMNYSDAYFSKLFKQCFNKNFITYLTEARIEAARELLRNPAVNIKEIGIQVGYQDSNYFTKVFRRATGKSPSEYRSTVLSGVSVAGLEKTNKISS